MEQRDYLKKQIDQLGQVLAKLFIELIGLKNSGQINAGIEITDQTLKNELDFDVQGLLDIPTDKFIDRLVAQKGLTNENLDKLAEILMFIADNREDNNKQLFEKCLTIYEYLEKVWIYYKKLDKIFSPCFYFIYAACRGATQLTRWI